MDFATCIPGYILTPAMPRCRALFSLCFREELNAVTVQNLHTLGTEQVGLKRSGTRACLVIASVPNLMLSCTVQGKER